MPPSTLVPKTLVKQYAKYRFALRQPFIGFVDVNEHPVADVRFGSMARLIPESQIFSIARRNFISWHQKKISRVDALLGQERQRLGVTRMNPNRRVGLLQWLYRERDIFILVERPLKLNGPWLTAHFTSASVS